MKLSTVVLFVVASLSTAALSGCAAETSEQAVDADEAELRTLRSLVAGQYASGLGQITLKSDGSYEGGYADAPGEAKNEKGLLIDQGSEKGTFLVRRAPLAPKGTALLSDAVLTLKPSTGKGLVKVHDLVVLSNRDIKVTRDGVSQIWVKQR
jgi:hypothetical protein